MSTDTKLKKKEKNVKNLENSIRKARFEYYNKGNSFLSDQNYDKKIERLIKLDPNNKLLKEVGYSSDQDKKKLPLIMGSLEKERPSNIKNWVSNLPKNSEIIITPKLDGLSVLLYYRNGRLKRAYTRGNGIEGRDITDKIKLLNLPELNIKESLYIKGEIIIEESNFEKYFKNNTNIKNYKNSRNFCAGIINSKDNTKDVKKALKNMYIVGFGLEFNSKDRFKTFRDTVERKNEMSKDVQLNLLERFGFYSVKRPVGKNLWTVIIKREKILENKDFETFIKNYIKQVKNFCELPVDGIVVDLVNGKDRNKIGYENNGMNPKFARSVKLDQIDQETKKARVKNINWNLTSRGLLKPVLNIEKSYFNGVEVSNVTGHNACFIKENKIGKNSVIKVIRSGDVIPYVVGVSKKKKPDIPKICPYCKGKIKETNKDIYCNSKDCSQKRLLKIQSFFSKLKTEELNDKTIENLWNSGYTSIEKILKLKPKNLTKIEGFGDKKANKIRKEIDRSLNTKLARLMHASGYFNTKETGLGEKRLSFIIDTFGAKKILDNKICKQKLLKDIKMIEGFDSKTAEIFVNNIDSFIEFYNSIKDRVKLNDFNKKRGKLSELTFCFSGFRDKNLSEIIENNGGTVSESVTKNTNVLFSGSKSSTKIEKAKKLNIKIIYQKDAYKEIEKMCK